MASAPASLAPANLGSLIVPLAFPEPRSSLFHASFQGWQIPRLPSLYFGALVLALAAAALGRVREPGGAGRAVAAWAAVAAVSFAAAVGGEALLPRWLRLAGVESDQALPAAVLAIAVMAGLGLAGLASGARRCLAALGGALGLLLAGMAVAAAALLSTGDWLPSLFLGGGAGLDPAQAARLCSMVGSAWLAALRFAVLVPLAACALLLACARGRLAAPSLACLLALLAGLDLTAVADRGLLGSGDAKVRAPAATAAWVAATRSGLLPARYLAYPPNDLAIGEDSTLLDHARLEVDLLLGLRGTVEGLQPLADLAFPRSAEELALVRLLREAGGRKERDRLAGALGASAVLSPEGLGNTPGEGEVLGTAGPVVVRRLSSPCPRLFVAARAVASEGSGLTTTALLSLPEEARFEPGPGLPQGPLQPASVRRCEVVSWGDSAVNVEVEVDGTGLLVLLERYEPDWTARVDGRERPVARVAGLFRGVEVRTGERRVEWLYRPRLFRLSLWPALAGVLLLGALCLRRLPTGSV
jgi:hypothetical protein